MWMKRLLPLVLFATPLLTRAAGPELHPLLLQAERSRVHAVDKVTPATIAVFDNKGEGGGSGVIIRSDGLAVTNFHVVAPCGPFMSCGLPDGTVVPAVLLGLDPPGDVALIRLLDDREYPVAEIGDSDSAAAGDEVYVVGNPFLLAEDLQPTVTHGVLSGVHRYQYPADTILEYADCLQTDAAINPGNSGGPLYNAGGQLIGVNGRASFEKRGRVNVGVGYAISINQVMRFVSALESGRVVDHARLGLTVRTLGRGRVVIDAIDSDSDAFRRGLRYGDQVLRVAGRDVGSANEVQNIIATYPPGSRLAVRVRRPGEKPFEVRVRLERAHAPGRLEGIVEEQLAKLSGDPPVAHAYEARPGFANYLVNRTRRDQIVQACPQRVEAATDQPWNLSGRDDTRGMVVMRLASDRASFASDRGEYWIDPTEDLSGQRDPPGSGGLLAALSLWRTLLTAGPDGLQDCYYLGQLPRGGDERSMECIVANHNGARAEFYFVPKDLRLARVEYFGDDESDPCVLHFEQDADGPGPGAQRVVVSVGESTWLDLRQVKLSTTGEAP